MEISKRALSIFLRCLLVLNIFVVVDYFLALKYSLFNKQNVLYHVLQEEKLPGGQDPALATWFSDAYFIQRGNYWVGYNKIPATENFHGNESITLSTPADTTNLDNLETLVKRWEGPVSCALFVPGTDYADALKVIRYLRECIPGTSALIQKFVTFHLFFPKDHIPPKLKKYTFPQIQRILPVNCHQPPNWKGTRTYRRKRNLIFPINVARNIAREQAKTHFVFASDIELYPSPGFIPKFLRFLQDPHASRWLERNSKFRRVYVLPVFELDPSVQELPSTKLESTNFLKEKRAISFHQHICDACHRIPQYQEWILENFTESVFPQNVSRGSIETPLKIHAIVKRRGKQRSWEPFYVGTKSDPVFDERVTWEGRSNKKIQAFTMCLLDYDFLVLDGAFLVHRPGIKRRSGSHRDLVKEMNFRIRKVIVPELKRLYGSRQGCVI